ncbi:MAG TPA: type II secretion system protein, partial [Sphingopyxis sp.]|nr:type II secretion system protein [Sphingopyxis sp.]
MRIFAATPEARPRPHANGFTLVELMVVLAIMALAATAVVLTIPGEERTVRSEAD